MTSIRLRERVAGSSKLQEKHGVTKEEAELQADRWFATQKNSCSVTECAESLDGRQIEFFLNNTIRVRPSHTSQVHGVLAF